ncbi:MAG: perosamine synthetase [Candidatus Marinamargulisbacteria bacterium]|jgi:perosamine synthetase
MAATKSNLTEDEKVAAPFLPYSRQSIDETDIAAVLRVLKSDYLTQGPQVQAFEEEFAAYTGAKYAVAVNNGTAALHLAYLAAGVGPGDEVVTTPVTFLATTNAALYCGATPVFADIRPDTYNIDPEKLAAALTPKTKLVVPVHLAGLPCDMSAIYEKAKANGSWVIEDACHALGAKIGDDKVGNCRYSDMAVFSFHPVKPIAAGEGGLITTNDPQLYEKLCSLRCHGMTKDPKKCGPIEGPWYYEMQDLGYNYRITDIQCALARTQLKKLDSFIEKRRKIAARYDTEFRDLPFLTVPREPAGFKSGYHLYVCLIDFDYIGADRASVMDALRAKGIGSQVHYIPIYRQPYYEKFGMTAAQFPVAESYYAKALSIPLFPDLSIQNMTRVIDAVKALG